MDDSILFQCNETELLQMARDQGLGHLRRGLQKDVLVAIVAGEIPVAPEHLAGTNTTRAMLQKFIQDNILVTRSQLPGCNGMCLTYGCSEGRHALCFVGNEDRVRLG